MSEPMSPNLVQDFLDSVVEGEVIQVQFLTKSGEVRTYEGTLDVGANRSQMVAIYTMEGWKKFNIASVIFIGKVD